MCTIPRINIDVFINIRNDPLLVASQSIQNKYNTLIANHKCFSEQVTDNHDKYIGKSHSVGFNAKWKNQSFVKKNDSSPMQFERLLKRPTIGNNNSLHRDFMSILNKITNVNEDKMLLKVRDIIKYEYISTYISLIWDMMLRCPDFQYIYINIVNIIRTEYNLLYLEDFQNIWDTYVLNNKWLPDDKTCDSLLDTNMIKDAQPQSDANIEYDEFCEFVKWKKRANAAINAFMLLKNNNIVEIDIINELTKYIVDDTQKYLDNGVDVEIGINDAKYIQITTALLDQILSIINTFKVKKCDESKKYIRNFIENNIHNLNKMSPSNKFKFIDITEKMKEINLYRINR